MIIVPDCQNGFSDVSILHSEISGGEFPSNGSAIVLDGHCNVDLNGVIFRNNSGGVLSLENKAALHAKHCIFESNYGENGSAIHSKDAVNVTLESCIFQNNSGGDGGAVALLVSIWSFRFGSID